MRAQNSRKWWQTQSFAWRQNCNTSPQKKRVFWAPADRGNPSPRGGPSSPPIGSAVVVSYPYSKLRRRKSSAGDAPRVGKRFVLLAPLEGGVKKSKISPRPPWTACGQMGCARHAAEAEPSRPVNRRKSRCKTPQPVMLSGCPMVCQWDHGLLCRVFNPPTAPLVGPKNSRFGRQSATASVPADAQARRGGRLQQSYP